MFYKRRVWVPPPWWVRVNDRQRQYARRLACWLGRRAARVPVRRMRWYVVLFFGGLVGLNVVLVWRSLGRHPVQRVRLPVMKTVSLPPVRRATAPDLWVLLDSLRKLPEGKRVFDSMVASRPGLADSLRWMEGLK